MEHKEHIHGTHDHDKKENHHEKKHETTPLKTSANIPAAIIVGALILGGALYLSKTRTSTSGNIDQKPASAVASVGVDEAKFKACFESNKHADKVKRDIDSAARATAHIPASEGRGTPYSVAITKDGRKAEIAGAYPIEATKGIIDGLLNNPGQNQVEITIDPITEEDHVFGNRDAELIVVEYSDLECPFCARFHQVMNQIVKDYNGRVAWVYRHLPLAMHENAEPKALASECIAELGGNDAFWKYIDLLLEEVVPKKKIYDPLKN